LGPHSSAGIGFSPNENYWLANMLRFRITIGAQNGIVLENLELRPTKDGGWWEYQFDIIRSVSKIHRGRVYKKDSSGNLYRGDGGVYSEIVKHQDWTEREEEPPRKDP
jgi:hypothetical protein